MTRQQDASLDRLQQCLTGMVALEGRIEALLDRLGPEVQGHSGAAAAFGRFHAVAKDHRERLAAHLRQLGVSVDVSTGVPAGMADGQAGHAGQTQASGAPLDSSSADTGGGVCAGAVSRALRDAYLAFNDSAIGYSVLHETAHVFDSLRNAATLRLAERHLRGYAAAAQELNQLIADVVSWELRQEGQFCVCQCPACALGICWCTAHTTDAINQAWRDTAPPHPSPGLRVAPNPRRPADLDVREGDVVIAVDGRRVATTADVTAAVLAHGPGEPIRFGIERPSAGTLEITATRQ